MYISDLHIFKCVGYTDSALIRRSKAQDGVWWRAIVVARN